MAPFVGLMIYNFCFPSQSQAVSMLLLFFFLLCRFWYPPKTLACLRVWFSSIYDVEIHISVIIPISEVSSNWDKSRL